MRFKVGGEVVNSWSRREGDGMNYRYVIGCQGTTKDLREVSSCPLKVTVVSVVVCFLQPG